MPEYILILSGDVPAEHETDGDAVTAWLRANGAVEDVGTVESIEREPWRGER